MKILLTGGIVWFFTRQFILYRRFKKRGLYDTDRIGLLEEIRHIRKGYRQAKKDFIRE